MNYRRILLWLFVPFTATTVALLGSWGAAHPAFAFPLVAVVQLAYVGALWRASDARLRTYFIAALIVGFLGDTVLVETLGLFHFTVGGVPVAVTLAFASLLWACIVFADLVGADLRPDRIARVVALAAVLGAAGIAFALQDFQQLLPFAIFPIVYFSVRRPATRLLVGVAFFAGLVFELYGTAVGAWSWAAGINELPTIAGGFRNPPYGAAGLYAGALILVLFLAPRLEPVVAGGLSPMPRPRRERDESATLARETRRDKRSP